MSENAIAKRDVGPLAAGVIEQVVIRGDLTKLNENQRLSYYQNLCHSLNLNALTKPFEYIQLNGKLVLYATRSCTDQLRFNHKISIVISKRELTEQFYAVTAVATAADGRTDESIGVVSVIGLKANDLANALMKGETKAKRRVALSICGLGFLDELETETISNIVRPEPTAEEIYEGTAQQTEYTVPFGKFKDMRLKDIGEQELKAYIKWIRERALSQNKEIQGDVKEFLELADGHIENKFLDEGFKAAMR